MRDVFVERDHGKSAANWPIADPRWKLHQEAADVAALLLRKDSATTPPRSKGELDAEPARGLEVLNDV